MRIRDSLRLLSVAVPSFIRNPIRFRKDQGRLRRVPPIRCNTEALRTQRGFSLKAVFSSPDAEEGWKNSAPVVNQFSIPDGTGGINPGDGRAVYGLVSYLKPTSVLEVGTHIGASTVSMAAAMKMNAERYGQQGSLTTVDIVDVNCPVRKPWIEYGSKQSPRDMIEEMNCGSFVTFLVGSALAHMSNSAEKFDLIFLDGDHSAAAVYQEIPAALQLLKDNGVILLHDYFPGLKPLWPSGSVIPGPFLAVERHTTEGADFTVLPLGELPWPTKQDSHATSLALLLRP